MNIKTRAKTDYIVVHCSATPPKMNIGVAEIDQWHRKRGFIKVGYHFVIRRNGLVEAGRAVDEVGSHVAGHNSNSVGICMVGGLDDKLKPAAEFTKDQWTALEGLLRNLKSLYPAAEILGHRDFPGVAKDCPCFDVRKFVKENISE